MLLLYLNFCASIIFLLTVFNFRNQFLQPHPQEGSNNTNKNESTPNISNEKDLTPRSISMEKECCEQYEIESAKTNQVVGRSVYIFYNDYLEILSPWQAVKKSGFRMEHLG